MLCSKIRRKQFLTVVQDDSWFRTGSPIYIQHGAEKKAKYFLFYNEVRIQATCDSINQVVQLVFQFCANLIRISEV